MDKDKDTAKNELRQVLKQYNGDTKNPNVMNTINKLSSFQGGEYEEKLLEGDWLLISAPSFPQAEQLPDGRFCYTLGRLSFNMFQPTDLKLVIDRVLQPVFPIDNTAQNTHNIVVEFTVIDNKYPEIKGILRNLGVCETNEHNRIKFKFTGGVLEPQIDVNLNTWKSIFANQKLVSKQSFKDKLKAIFLKFIFGLVHSKKMNQETGTINFEMKRSPKGSLEILYLDEELRITKGEKGTILACEKIR